MFLCGCLMRHWISLEAAAAAQRRRRRRRRGKRASVLLPGNLATALLPAYRALKRMPCISEKPGAYSEIPRTLFSLERNHWSIGLCAAPPPSPLPRYILRVTAYWLEGLFQKIAHNLRNKRFPRKTEEPHTECWGRFWPLKFLAIKKKAHSQKS